MSVVSLRYFENVFIKMFISQRVNFSKYINIFSKIISGMKLKICIHALFILVRKELWFLLQLTFPLDL